MKYLEYAGWTYTIERVERYGEIKFLVIVYNKADDTPRTSCHYESLYEAEVLVQMTINDLNVWFPL
jgi:hypothetical protein